MQRYAKQNKLIMYMFHHHALCIDELKMYKKLSQNKDMQLSKKGIAICLDVHCFIVNAIICCSSGVSDNVTLHFSL